MTFAELPCDGVTAHNLPSFADLLALHAKLQDEHPGLRVLVTLDNLGQASYTSGHCIDTHELDDLDEDLDEDDLDEDYEDSPPDFSARLANLLRLASEVGLDQVRGALPWETPGDANDLVTINRDPDAALQLSREKEVIFQFVPVETSADAIAAFPNGYFTADLSPMQNHALARHLEVKFGFALIGIGSRFLGFRRPGPLTEAVAHELAVDLAGLYANADEDDAFELAAVITGRDSLLVRYTES